MKLLGLRIVKESLAKKQDRKTAEKMNEFIKLAIEDRFKLTNIERKFKQITGKEFVQPLIVTKIDNGIISIKIITATTQTHEEVVYQKKQPRDNKGRFTKQNKK